MPFISRCVKICLVGLFIHKLKIKTIIIIIKKNTESFKSKASSPCEMALRGRGLKSLSVAVWQSSLAVSCAAGSLFPQLSVTARAAVCYYLIAGVTSWKMLPPLLHRPGWCLCTVRLPQPLHLFALPLCLPSSLRDL